MSWLCPKCETENLSRLKICEVCDSPRDSSPVEKLKERLKKKYCDSAYKSFIRYHYSLLDSADKGCSIDQYTVGEWFSGRRNAGATEIYSKIAALWYTEAAKQGHTAAQAKLALCYEEGRGVPQSRDAAIKWYKEAAKKGDEVAKQRYLKLKYDSKTYKAVVKYKTTMLWEADNGSRNFQYLLGEWFSCHNGQPLNKEEAIVWYTFAAQNGHGEAMLKLGECYEKGLGVNYNFTTALKWYKKAAKSGSHKTCVKLAEIYLYGRRVNKDVREAIKWYNLSGKDISRVDLCNIGYAYDIGDGIQMDKKIAVDYYRKAAEKGDMVAQYNLGVCFENGNGVTKDLDTAKYWYEKAASKGHSQAQQCVARISSEIKSQKQENTIGKIITYIIFGPIMGVIGYSFLESLPEWGIHLPEVWPNIFPTNLIICIIIGFIVWHNIAEN